MHRAEEAVQRTAASREHVHLGHAYLRLAMAQAQRGKPFMDDAESAYRKALERAETHGMRPLAAECHEGLGKLHLKRGQSAAARKAFEAAAKLYSETGLAGRAKVVTEAAAA